MTDAAYPISRIRPTPLTITAITPTTVLVDDPVALVDSSTTLTGSLVTPSADIRSSTRTNAPRSKVVISR